MTYILEAQNITLQSHGKKLVSNLSFDVRPSENLCIIDAEGMVIKSLVEMLCGKTKVQIGELYINGINTKLSSPKGMTGLVSLDYPMDPHFSVKENLYLYANYFGLGSRASENKINELIRQVACETFIDRFPLDLSVEENLNALAMRALIPDIKLLVIEEPESINHKLRTQLKKLVDSFQSKQCGVVYLTQSVCDAENFCNKVLILYDGKVICAGEPNELVKERVGTQTTIFSYKDQELEYYLNKIKDHYQFQVYDNQVRLYAHEQKDLSETLALIPSEDILVRKSNLEDVFFKMTKFHDGSQK